MSLPSLGQAGLLLPTSKPRLASRGSVYFVRSSVEELEKRCLAAARSGSPPEGSVSIFSAVVRLQLASSNPWPGIIDKILRGQLTIWTADRKALMHVLRLASISELQGVVNCQDIAFGDPNRLTVADAAALLSTTESKMGKLIKRGFVPARPTSEQMRQFMSEFILTAEIAALLRQRGHRCWWRDIPQILRSAGIEPVAFFLFRLSQY